MELPDSSPPRDTPPEQTPLPSRTGVPERWAKGFRSTAIDLDLGERFMSQVRESVSSVLEYDEEMRLKEESLRKQALELQKKEERLRMVEERERSLEDSITERLGVLQEKEKEANVMRFVFEKVVTQLKEQEKLLQVSMIKKHEELMRELQVRKQELEARENELRLLSETIKEKSTELKKKEDKFQLKRKSESSEIEVKSKLLKLKEKVLEERERVLEQKQKELEAETSNNPRHESEPSDNGRDADSHVHIGKKHKPVREYNHDDGGKCEMHHIKSGKNVTTINPRKGETWALYKDWTKSWITDREQHEPPYRYDFVQVQTEFDSDQGIGVAYLRRVEGFTSVYKLAEQHGLIRSLISSDQMLRFSHRVPSFKLTGDEKEGVPAGSFELDPASILS